ncbi:TetR/AcrR family transcriptional regulator [Pseudonocardia alni subsp. carboxydivorans]|uniref:Helix-turn-helix domain-containing protein n=1 Tax=Pseudonocardia alni subsp. carboxydivorans TaxID=415010 RepID=A0ABU9AG44_PSEA5
MSGRTGARRPRSDAQRNVDALLDAARRVFDTSGVDAPAKEITDLAGVGVGTLYRHFPQRADLVKAVVETGIDALADAGPQLASEHPPVAALTHWLDRFIDLLATKRGLASALHSGNPAFDGLPGHFTQRLGPALAALLDAAVGDGAIRRDAVSAEDLLFAVPQLCRAASDADLARGRRLVALLVEGLRTGRP